MHFKMSCGTDQQNIPFISDVDSWTKQFEQAGSVMTTLAPQPKNTTGEPKKGPVLKEKGTCEGLKIL